MTEALRFLEECGVDPREMRDDLLPRRRIPSLDEFALRDDFIRRFGFAILTPEAVEAIRSYAPILEVGAGSGYWAWELRHAGVEVAATDPGTGRYHAVSDDGWPEPWTEIERITALEALDRFPTHTLLMVWPDLAEWPAEALRAYKGEWFLYVGEYQGATADEAFHDLLESDFEEERVINLPVFYGLHDRLMIYRRRNGDADA